MDQVLKSGFYCSNKFAFIALRAYEDLIGKNNLSSILNQAGLNQLIESYPPDNLDLDFNFADFTAIHTALEVKYGPRGGQGLAQRAGRTAFDDGLKDFGAFAGVRNPAFKELPLQTRLQVILPSATKIFSKLADLRSTVVETDSDFLWRTSRCPVCWNRQDADKPVCYLTSGFLQGLLTWVSDGLEFRVNESRCMAMGDEICEFVIQKEPMD